MSDHARGCPGREYVCTCGYDGGKDAEIARLTKKADEDFTSFKKILDRYIDAKWKSEALIRDLVAALAGVMNCWGNEESAKADRAARAALTRAKEAGYE